MDINVKNGTPLYGPSLCETCVNAFIARGYRETEQVVICQHTYPERVVKFPVRSCSGYVEVKRQTLKQMEEIAWQLQPRSCKRQAGFVSPQHPENGDQEIELILDGKK
jgi:hypothetical protein